MTTCPYCKNEFQLTVAEIDKHQQYIAGEFYVCASCGEFVMLNEELIPIVPSAGIMFDFRTDFPDQYRKLYNLSQEIKNHEQTGAVPLF